MNKTAWSIKPKEFVEIWQKSESLTEVTQKVARKIGGVTISNSSVSMRASYFRKKSVPLKYFRERGGMDFAALKTYAESLA